MPAPSLLEVLQGVPDPRSRQGRSYPLPAILALLILGMLLGRRSLTAISQLVRDYGDHLALLLGFPRTRTPCVSALSGLLRRLDVQAFERVLAEWIRQATSSLPPTAAASHPALPPPPPAGPTPIHMDGKTLRGSRNPAADLPGVHLLSAFAPRVHAVLAQIRVDSKTNEHKAALELLNLLPQTPGGNLVTGDAIFCQKEVCQKISDRNDHYLLTVKDNQPGLAIDIDAGLAFAETARSFSP
jgi:DDE_Tnp_1-associated/Transposase DDE domain